MSRPARSGRVAVLDASKRYFGWMADHRIVALPAEHDADNELVYELLAR